MEQSLGQGVEQSPVVDEKEESFVIPGFDVGAEVTIAAGGGSDEQFEPFWPLSPDRTGAKQVLKWNWG